MRPGRRMVARCRVERGCGMFTARRDTRRLLKPLAILGLLAAMLTLLLLLLAQAQHAHAETITVNSAADVVADDGVCTLREAITAANTDAASGATPGGDRKSGV